MAKVMEHTLNDLVAEFDRLAAMPDDTFFISPVDGIVYFNCMVSDEPTEDEVKKYEGLVKITEDLTDMCCDLLIGHDGSCNWSNIHKLQALGFRVYATDKDSFGWLCANVEKDNHIVSYG